MVPRQRHAEVVTTVAALALLIWLYLLLALGRFWHSEPELEPTAPVTAPPTPANPAAIRGIDCAMRPAVADPSAG